MNTFVLLSCPAECWEGFFRSRIGDGHTTDLACPSPGCGRVISAAEVEAAVDAETFAKFKRFTEAAKLNDDPDVRW